MSSEAGTSDIVDRAAIEVDGLSGGVPEGGYMRGASGGHPCYGSAGIEALRMTEGEVNAGRRGGMQSSAGSEGFERRCGDSGVSSAGLGFRSGVGRHW